jgi:hypothetical protein
MNKEIASCCQDVSPTRPLMPGEYGRRRVADRGRSRRGLQPPRNRPTRVLLRTGTRAVLAIPMLRVRVLGCPERGLPEPLMTRRGACQTYLPWFLMRRTTIRIFRAASLRIPERLEIPVDRALIVMT